MVGLGAAIYYYGSFVALAQAAKQVITVEMPAVFAEFATATTAYTASQAWIYGPLAKAAKTKAYINWMTMLGGIGLTGFTPKLAQFFGKLRIAFSENSNSVAQGLNPLADHAVKAPKTIPIHQKNAYKVQEQARSVAVES